MKHTSERCYIVPPVTPSTSLHRCPRKLKAVDCQFQRNGIQIKCWCILTKVLAIKSKFTIEACKPGFSVHIYQWGGLGLGGSIFNFESLIVSKEGFPKIGLRITSFYKNPMWLRFLF